MLYAQKYRRGSDFESIARRWRNRCRGNGDGNNTSPRVTEWKGKDAKESYLTLYDVYEDRPRRLIATCRQPEAVYKRELHHHHHSGCMILEKLSAPANCRIWTRYCVSSTSLDPSIKLSSQKFHEDFTNFFKNVGSPYRR